jgi:CBS domain-containing protein
MGKELRAADVMQSEVLSVPSTLPMIDLERLLMREGVGGVPVVDDGRLVGIISRSDVLRYLTSDQAAASVDSEYYWDFGGATAPRASGDAPAADPGAIEQVLGDLAVADLMVKDIVSVTPDQPLSHVAAVMESRHVHRVLVVEKHTLRGVLTTMDMTRVIARGQLVAGDGDRQEEIVR